MDRHPYITNLAAQALLKTRNTVDFEDIRMMFNFMATVIIETGATVDRIFNVDETAFYKASNSKRVIAVRRSKNVWTTIPAPSFHMAIIACGSSAGVFGMALFEEWLAFEAASVPVTIKRPLVLVMDGCGAHYSSSVVTLACNFGIMLSELTIRRHILTLPVPPKKYKKRKTVAVGGQIPTELVMKELEREQAQTCKRKKAADILDEAVV
ncbi:hypothetical protein ON010_g13683 [Phytophthora cinnamomi]|nr:hypothetical protein ON010_g13683 [Phytophthora cinnamomi]